MYTVIYLENIRKDYDDSMMAAEAAVICRLSTKILMENIDMEVSKNRTSGRKSWRSVEVTSVQEVSRFTIFPPSTQWFRTVEEAMIASFPV